MIDQAFQWSEANWSAKPAPDLLATPSDRILEPSSRLLVKWVAALAAILLLASTIYGYFLIAHHNETFQLYSEAETIRNQTLELTKAIVALDHAEHRFNMTGLQDELDDVHHMLHGVVLAVFKALDASSNREFRIALNQVSDGLEEHRRLLLTLLQGDETTRHRNQFPETSTSRLFSPLEEVSSIAALQSTQAEVDFNSTTRMMFWAVGTADFALLIGILSLLTLHRHRVQKLAKNQKSLFDKNRTLRAAVKDQTTRLGQFQTMFKSSLSATNMTMFIQNTELVISWIHNSKFGDSNAIIGKRDQDFMPPEAWHQTVKFKKEVIESRVGKKFEFSYSIDGRAIYKWLQIDPIIEDDRVIGIIGVSIDMTDRILRETKIEALAAELAHRNQNLIAVISAIARQMLNTSHTLNEFENRFTPRLHSIARSFDLIVGEDWQGAPLRALVREQMIAVDKTLMDRVKLTGHDILLCPEYAESIGTAIHELTQNALTYGAFAKPYGHVTIDWWIETDLFDKKTLSLIWNESDGSQKIPSLDHHGYGLNVLEKVVPQSLNGNAFVVAQPGGLKCRMRCAWKEPSRQKNEEVVYLNA